MQAQSVTPQVNGGCWLSKRQCKKRHVHECFCVLLAHTCATAHNLTPAKAHVCVYIYIYSSGEQVSRAGKVGRCAMSSCLTIQNRFCESVSASGRAKRDSCLGTTTCRGSLVHTTHRISGAVTHRISGAVSINSQGQDSRPPVREQQQYTRVRQLCLNSTDDPDCSLAVAGLAQSRPTSQHGGGIQRQSADSLHTHNKQC